MTKRIELTDGLKAKIEKILGGPPKSWDNIAAFETVAVTNLPVNKKGTIWDKAVIKPMGMQKLAQLSDGTQYIPLHTLHNQGWELPVGRIFDSGVKTVGDYEQLHNLFYLDTSNEDEEKLANKLDTGVIEEVSVGISWNTLPCSGCSWDFLSDKSGYALWERTCENGHVLGMGEYHLALDNPKAYNELSLVSKGASTGARVLPKNQRMLAQLQANGDNPTQTYMQCSPTLAEEATMTPEQILALQTQVATLQASETDLKSKVTLLAEADSKLTAAQAKISELEPKLTAVEAAKTEAETKLAAAEEKLTATEVAKTEAETKLAEATGKLTALEASIKPAPGSPAFKLPLSGVQNIDLAQHSNKPSGPAIQPSPAYKMA